VEPDAEGLVTAEHDAVREISAGLLVYARDVEAYAEKYHCPELLRWVERLRAGVADVVAHVERRTTDEEGP
jgi:hypothetical protein